MVKIISLTSILSEILFFAMIGNLFLLVADVLSFPISILIMLICIIFRMGLNKLSWFMYFNSLNRCDTDYDGFMKQQKKYCNKCKKKVRSMNTIVEQNKIAGMIYHEDFDNAKKDLIALGKTLAIADPLSKFQYLSFLLAIELHQKKFKGVSHFISEMRELLSQINFSDDEYSETSSTKFESILEGYRISNDFYQIDPDNFSSYDKTVAEKMISKADKMLELLPEMKTFPHYFKLINYHDKAVAYVLLNEKEKAEPLFAEIAATDYTYPFVKRVKQYQETGDIHILI